jgi:hypothetical protein
MQKTADTYIKKQILDTLDIFVKQVGKPRNALAAIYSVAI